MKSGELYGKFLGKSYSVPYCLLISLKEKSSLFFYMCEAIFDYHTF